MIATGRSVDRHVVALVRRRVCAPADAARGKWPCATGQIFPRGALRLQPDGQDHPTPVRRIFYSRPPLRLFTIEHSLSEYRADFVVYGAVWQSLLAYLALATPSSMSKFKPFPCPTTYRRGLAKRAISPGPERSVARITEKCDFLRRSDHAHLIYREALPCFLPPLSCLPFITPTWASIYCSAPACAADCIACAAPSN
jgi:hypothetical protein